MKDWGQNMTERYKKWEKLIYKAAIKTIGRTTFKTKGPKQSSKEVRKLRMERTVSRKEFEKEKDSIRKKAKLDAYITKQKELTARIEYEEEMEVKERFEKMIDEANKGGFFCKRGCKTWNN